MNSNLKKVIVAVILLGAFSLILSFFQEKQKIKDKEVFIDQHNQQVLQLEVEKNEEEESLEDNSKNTSPDDPGDEVRKLTAYSKPLPPQPTVEDTKWSFPDVNQNKVRDDIEILIVEEFGGDEMVVEAFFADARRMEYILVLSDGDISKEDVRTHMDNVDKAVTCNFFYFTQFLGTENEYFKSPPRDKVLEGYYNTDDKENKRKQMRKASHLSVGGGFDYSHQSCQEFFEETRNLPIGN